MSPRRLQDMPSRRLQDVFARRLGTSKNCYAEDVFKTSSRHVLKMSSRRLQDQQMLAWMLMSPIISFCENSIIYAIFDGDLSQDLSARRRACEKNLSEMTKKLLNLC